jgi:hypothetical protein
VVTATAPGWPLQPLLDASDLTRTRLAAELHVPPSVIRLAGRRGLTDVQADEWAIRLGLHPLLVWGWAWIEEAATALKPARARVADRLRDLIARGELRAGDALPGVQRLAREWAVGAHTVAEALDDLRADGLVVGGVGRTGHPATVAATLPWGAVSCLACGRAIAPGDEHYPHRPHCTMAAHGWCDCDSAAHPECCPSCAGGAA